MVNYPSQLTSEEKSLRKRFSKLQEKLKELKKLSSKVASTQSSSSPGSSKKVAVKKLGGGPLDKKVDKNNTPKDALAAAKKLVEAGKVNIAKNTTKTTGFKRVGESISKTSSNPASTGPPLVKRSSSSFPPSYIPSGSKTTANKPKPVPKREESRQLYSRFIRASESVTHHKIPKRIEEVQSTAEDEQSFSSETKTVQEEVSLSKKECSVYVSWRDLQLSEDALLIAFSRFGTVVEVKAQSQNEAFVTFDGPNIAKTAQREMNKGMIRGTEIRVEFASDENGFIELPPEAASQPWARIAAGMEVSQPDLSNRKRPFSIRQTMSYEQDF